MLLKEKLLRIQSNGFAAPPDAFAFALEMAASIGSTDPQLRDSLIYSAFHEWICGDVFSSEELKKLLTLALDEQHLFYRIGENGTDSVFTRSFSVLLLPLILSAHRRQPFLDRADIRLLKDKLLAYVQAEQDLRGYVDEKGWAHAVAHMADALDDLAGCPELGKADLQQILASVQAKILVPQIVYAYEEDERMVTAVMAVLNRGLLTNEDIVAWLSGFVVERKRGASVDVYRSKINGKHFLRSLYYRLREQQQYGDIVSTLASMGTYK